MQTWYFYKDQIDTAKGLIEKSDRDARAMLGSLVEVLQRKELLSDKDIATILDIEMSELQRSPF